MKRFAYSTLLALVASVTLATSAIADSPVNWGTNLDAAIADGHVALIAVGATYCRTCEANKRNVLHSESVAARINQDFAPIYITADDPANHYIYQGDNRTGAQMMSELGLDGFPVYLLMDEDGNVIRRIGGRVTVESFLRFLG